jgi:hypothetical protein
MADAAPTDAGGSGATEWAGFDRFAAVQEVLDRNAVLIQQIDANHRARTPETLQRNVVLVRELNANVSRIVELYGDLAHALLDDTGGGGGGGISPGCGGGGSGGGGEGGGRNAGSGEHGEPRAAAQPAGRAAEATHLGVARQLSNGGSGEEAIGM